MKKTILLILSLFFSMAGWSAMTPEAVVNGNSLKPGGPAISIFKKPSSSKLSSIKRIGTRIQLKMEQWIIKHLISKKKKKEGTADLAQTAFVISLIGICSLIIPYINFVSLPLAIIGLVLGYKALRDDPNSRKAKTAVILGWVTIGLWVLAALLILTILLAIGI